MYAHQVVEDLEELAKVVSKELSGTIFALSQKIRSSQKFYIGEAKEIASATKVDDLTDYFLHSDHEIRLPYPYTYCEFSEGGPRRVAFLLEEHSPDLFTIFFFETKKLIHDSINIKWIPSFFCIDVSVGVDIQKNPNATPILNANEFPDETEKVFGFIPIRGVNEARVWEIIKENQTRAWNVVYCTCFLLNILDCRNIETIDNPPPEKLNKKRIKSGKQPIFTYKTLAIKPTGKQQQSIPKHLWENRIHLCRGHFKTYTEDAPLFGRYTGRYWWQPSVRGRNKEGVVMKDYKVEA